jgi:valyl-tRNA synthetase
MVKPAYQQPIDSKTYAHLVKLFEKVLIVMHPFTPFVSEEIWHLLTGADKNETINYQSWPVANKVDSNLLAEFNNTVEVITGIRTIRKENGLANKNTIEFCITKTDNYNTKFDSVIAKLGNISEISFVTEKVSNAFSFIVKGNEYFVPFSDDIDVDAEIAKLKKELDYEQGFLKSVDKKLSNERFVNNAPDQVIANERNKQADALNKIKIIEEKLASF